MYKELVAKAQSVLTDKFGEGAELTNAEVKLYAPDGNSGCVEFEYDGNRHKINFDVVSENEADMSDEIITLDDEMEEETEVEIETEAAANDTAESSSTEEVAVDTEEETKMESEKMYTQTEVDEMKGTYEKKMEEMKAEIENMKPGAHKKDNMKSEEGESTEQSEPEPTEEKTMVENAKSEESEEQSEETNEEVVENQKSIKTKYLKRLSYLA